jgi:hypothetical protein
MLTELIARDKNHPSVIAWSLSNEAKTNNPEAYGYYKSVFLCNLSQVNFILPLQRSCRSGKIF